MGLECAVNKTFRWYEKEHSWTLDDSVIKEVGIINEKKCR